MNKKDLPKASDNSNNKSKGLKEFVSFIKDQGNVPENNLGMNGSSGQDNSNIYFEISAGALVVGMPKPICYLKGRKLFYGNKNKLLSSSELNILYNYIKVKNDNQAFKYFLTLHDMTVMDGNTFHMSVKWNDIDIYVNGGTMPKGIQDLLDYCSNLVN
jgi:hypothetical protein